MVQSGSLGIRHKFETPISIPNLLHHSVAVWPEGNCLTSLRLNFLICELRVIMITLYRDAVRLGYIASICGSTLLAYFLILIIGDTNDLKGHLTWWMPPSLNPPPAFAPMTHAIPIFPLSSSASGSPSAQASRTRGRQFSLGHFPTAQGAPGCLSIPGLQGASLCGEVGDGLVGGVWSWSGGICGWKLGAETEARI